MESHNAALGSSNRALLDYVKVITSCLKCLYVLLDLSPPAKFLVHQELY